MLNEIFQHLNPVAFYMFGMPVRWYGIAYVLGFLIVGVLMWFVARRWKLELDAYNITVLVCFVAVGLLVFARIFYCIFYGDGYYFRNPSEIFAVSRGGMSFHGGLFGAIAGGFVYSRIYNIPLLTFADAAVCASPIALLFGRCANFINGELYGAQTNCALGVDFTGTGVMYHPSQLYEAFFEGVVLFAILYALSFKKPPFSRGFYSGLFLSLYALVRFSLEFVRLPDAQIGYFFSTWGTMGQALCVPMFVVGILLIVYAYKKRLPQCAYIRPYSDNICKDKNEGKD